MTIAVGIEIYVKVEAIAAALWVVILSLQTHILPDVSLMLIFCTEIVLIYVGL